MSTTHDYYEIEMLRLGAICPLHRPERPQVVADLATRMQADGWAGRPLLVYEVGDGYQAVTGSHRLAAARRARLDEIPCVVMLLPDGWTSDPIEFGGLRDADGCSIDMRYDSLADALEAVGGDGDAIYLCRLEIEEGKR